MPAAQVLMNRTHVADRIVGPWAVTVLVHHGPGIPAYFRGAPDVILAVRSAARVNSSESATTGYAGRRVRSLPRARLVHA